MRLIELFLFENKAEYIAAKQGEKLKIAYANDAHATKDQPIEWIVNNLASADPTSNQQYLQWIANQYAARKIRMEDLGRIKTYLTHFHKLKPRLQKKDLNAYTLSDLYSTIDTILNPELEKVEDENVKDATILYKGPLGQLSVPHTEEASCALGSGTKWCTAAKEDNMFNYYTNKGKINLYIWKDRNGKKYQFYFNPDDPSQNQYMDSQDIEIDDKTLLSFHNEHPVLSKLFQSEEKKLAKSGNSKKVYDYVTQLDTRIPTLEPIILNDPDSALEYWEAYIGKRWTEFEEKLIETDFPEAMARYITRVNRNNNSPHTRWPIFEPYLQKHPRSAFDYSNNVINGRWPEAEPYIFSDPYIAAMYVKYVINKDAKPGEERIRNKDAEASILRDTSLAIEYAHDVIRGRWPELEKILLEKGGTVEIMDYVRDIINFDKGSNKKRWHEAEEKILKDPNLATSYTIYLNKGNEGEPIRFKEAEDLIKDDPNVAGRYWLDVLNKDKMAITADVLWPEAEDAIMQSRTAPAYMSAKIRKERKEKK